MPFAQPASANALPRRVLHQLLPYRKNQPLLAAILLARTPAGSSNKTSASTPPSPSPAGTALVPKSQTAAPAAHTALVVLFHRRGCAYSAALLPVYRCLPAFFNASVSFLELDEANSTTYATMEYGPGQVPALSVAHKGREIMFVGNRSLPALVQFITEQTVR